MSLVNLENKYWGLLNFKPICLKFCDWYHETLSNEEDIILNADLSFSEERLIRKALYNIHNNLPMNLICGSKDNTYKILDFLHRNNIR